MLDPEFKKQTERTRLMKKLGLAFLVFGLAVASASAGVGLTWTTIYGGYTHDAANTTSSDDLLLDSYGVTWQLIYAGANNAIDPVELSNGINGWVSGDDDVWATRTIAQGGGTASEDSTDWDNWMTWQGSGSIVYEDLSWNTAGYVFQRVYEGTLSAGSWYFESNLLALNTGYTGSPGFPQEFALDSSSSGFQPNQQLIPEPATMGLLGLGALVMAIRRRRS